VCVPCALAQPRARGAVLWSRNPNGTLAVGMLPACQFTHGHLYLVAEVPQRLGLDVFVVHATYQFGERPYDTNTKRGVGCRLIR
jgi:hypothetical protein